MPAYCSDHFGKVHANFILRSKHVELDISYFLASDGKGLDWEYLQGKLNKHFDWNGAVNGILGTNNERAIDMVNNL